MYTITMLISLLSCQYKKNRFPALISVNMKQPLVVTFLVLGCVISSDLVEANKDFSTVYKLSTVDRVENTTFSAIPPASGGLEIYALPVGQGDCTIIQCPTGTLIVLDCGSSSCSPQFSAQQVQNYLGNRINDVSTIIISHPDCDHYNYLYQINFNATNIQNVIIGGTLGSYNGYHQDNQRIYAWLTHFQNLKKLQLVSGGNSCMVTVS